MARMSADREGDGSVPDFPAQRQSPAKNPVRRVTLAVVALGAVLFAYGIAGDRETPYTA